MTDAINRNEIFGNRDAFLEETVRRLEAELRQSNQDYDELLAEGKEFVDKTIDLQDVTVDQGITIDTQAKELELKNLELEKKNKELEEKARELEGVMAMFAHKFRGPVDSIIFNAEHQFHSPLLADIGRTMNGFLEIFRYISIDSEQLRPRLASDTIGPGTLGKVVRKSLWLALIQLLSPRRMEVMAPHYYAYAKKTGLISSDVDFRSWQEGDKFAELQKSLSTTWEIEVGSSDNSDCGQAIVGWCAEHIFSIDLLGIDEMSICFKSFGPKESVLIIFLTELFVNAIKHFDCNSEEGLTVTCLVDAGMLELSCRNPSSISSRNRGRGSGLGHKFLKLIAEKLGGEFVAPDTSGSSTAVVRVPSGLFLSDNV